MQDKVKITCYQELYAKLKESDLLSDFGWPAQKEHLDFYFNIGSTKIFFRIFSDKDLMQIRSETIRTDTKNEDNIALAQEISKNFYGIFGTSYDGKIIFNLSVPFPSVSDEAAKQMIVDKTNYFVNMVTSQLEQEYVASINEEKKRRLAEEETEKNKKKKLGFFQKKNSDSGEADIKEETMDPSPVSEAVISDKEEPQLELQESDFGLEADPSKESDVVEEAIKVDVPVKEVAVVKKAEIFDKKDAESVDILETENTAPLAKADEFPSEDISVSKSDTVKESAEGKEENQQEPHVAVEEENEFSDINNQDSIAIQTVSEEVSPVENPVSKPVTSNTLISAKGLVPEQQQESGISEKEMKHISELYESMNRTFNMRKDQLDYREQMLAEQKQFLKHDRDTLQKEKEAMKSQRLEIKGKEDSLKKNWEQYKKAKKRQEQQQERLDDREKKVKDLESDFSEKQKELEGWENTLSILEQEVSRKQVEIDKSWKEYQEKSATMADYEERLKITKQELAENELKLDMQKKQNAMERQAIDEKLADLKETEEMIVQMKQDSGMNSFTTDSEELKQAKEELEQMRHQVELMQEELISKASEANQAMQQIQIGKEECARLQKSCDELKEELSNMPIHEADAEQMDILKQHIEDLEVKNQDTETRYRKQLLGIQEQYDSLLREHGVLKKELETLNGPDIVSELTKGGFTVLNGEKNNRKLLTFSLGGCKIWIDEQFHMVEIEKETKRNYTKQMQELNDLAYDLSFCAGRGKVYCRFVYHDIVKEIRENIAIMVKFK
ncbi:MAG: hypothetical protein ACLRPE_12580 [Blautia producta]